MDPAITQYLNKVLRDNPSYRFMMHSAVEDGKLYYHAAIADEAQLDWVITGNSTLNPEKAIESMLLNYDKYGANVVFLFPED